MALPFNMALFSELNISKYTDAKTECIWMHRRIDFIKNSVLRNARIHVKWRSQYPKNLTSKLLRSSTSCPLLGSRFLALLWATDVIVFIALLIFRKTPSLFCFAELESGWRRNVWKIFWRAVKCLLCACNNLTIRSKCGYNLLTSSVRTACCLVPGSLEQAVNNL